MTNQNHPITPPPELVQPSSTQLNGIIDGLGHCYVNDSKREYLKTWIEEWTIDKIKRAAHWGADQELEDSND